MLLGDWLSADKREWVDGQRVDNLDEVDKMLVKSLKVTFMTGKVNNHLVPIIFTPDTVEVIKILNNPAIRDECKVDRKNKYVFPTIQNSDHHVSGWHALNKMCEQIKDELTNVHTLTATANRHRVSTLFSMLDLPKKIENGFTSKWGIPRA